MESPWACSRCVGFWIELISFGPHSIRPDAIARGLGYRPPAVPSHPIEPHPHIHPQKYLLVTTSYEARARGVGKMMSLVEARRRCPDLVVVNGEARGRPSIV